MAESFLKLAALPAEHSLRNRPLAEIGAECRNVQTSVWRPVAHWSIGQSTYNALRGPWLEFNEWRAPAPR
jgi:hypothetical protein